MESHSSQNKSTLHSEHLTNGERPIIASVEGYGDFPEGEISEDSNYFLIHKEAEEGNADYAEYLGDADLSDEQKSVLIDEKRKQGFFVDDSGDYIISPINAKGKVSLGYLFCTGVIGAGREKETKENIAFISHQMPDVFLPGAFEHDRFVADFSARITELKQKAVPGSIDVVILGGEYYENDKEYEKDYVDAINLLRNEVKKVLEFDPVVITGPKYHKDGGKRKDEGAFFDTANRRLYLSRPETGDATSESFMPDDIISQRKKWRNKE
jgi:hypothetical protein